MPSIIIEQALNLCEEFKTFSAAEKQVIASICEVREYEAGRDVFSIEHQERYVFIVVLGQLSLRLRNGKRGEFKRGDLFGEITLFSDSGRLGAIHCKEKASLALIDKYGILDATKGLPAELRFKLLLMLGRKMARYLYEDNSIRPVEELLQHSEGQQLEFKQSLADRTKIEDTIVAFMNAQGGTILVGVENSGKLIGLQHKDEYVTDMMVRITNDIKGKTKQVAATYFDYDIQPIKGKKVLRIIVDPSTMPIHIRSKSKDNSIVESFLVRTGAQNTNLKTAAEVREYKLKRFTV